MPTPQRRYAPRTRWHRVAPDQLESVELRQGADRAAVPGEGYRVDAVDGEQAVTLEVLWIRPSRRAGVATPDGVYWTDTPTIETALHLWAADTWRGVRSGARE